MKPLWLAPVFGAALLFGCVQLEKAAGDVCGEVARIEADPAALAPLAALDPHSAAGVLWADLAAGCKNGIPAPGVATQWLGLVASELASLAPGLVPLL